MDEAEVRGLEPDQPLIAMNTAAPSATKVNEEVLARQERRESKTFCLFHFVFN